MVVEYCNFKAGLFWHFQNIQTKKKLSSGRETFNEQTLIFIYLYLIHSSIILYHFALL